MQIYNPQDPEVRDVLGRLCVLTLTRSRGKPQATEFLDMETGEIFDAPTVQKMGARVVRPETRIQRERKLNSLRPEPKRFAMFLLRFRDSRCKFLIDLDELIKMYSRLTTMQPQHVRRYLPALVKAGILDDDHTLNQDFMINNPTAGKEVAKGDRFRAVVIFDRIALRAAALAT